MKVELSDSEIGICFEEKSENQRAMHVLSFYGDGSEIDIYLSDKEVEKLKEELK